MAGTYQSSTDASVDSDTLETLGIGNCNQSTSNGMTAGTPCDYSAPFTMLTAGGTALAGTLSTGTDSGQIQSPNTGALTPFETPTTLSLLSSSSGATWQGAISLNDLGGEWVAMQTAAATGSVAAPNLMVGLVPSQGESVASLSGSFQLLGIATNLTTGVSGDEGILQAVAFNGSGALTGSESINTWNPATQSGGIQQSTTSLTGSYTVAADGGLTVSFTSGVLSGYTLTGAMNGKLLVLTGAAAIGPRVLLVGIVQPANNNQLCSGSPLIGPGLADGVFTTVALSFNTSAIRQVTFTNSSGPTYAMSLGSGTLNTAGTYSAYPAAGPFNYSIDSSCFITVTRQTDSSSTVLEASYGVTDPSGAIVAFEDFDTMGQGPILTVGVRISNVLQLQ